MHPDELIEATRRETVALAAAAKGRMEAEVPSCPGWTLEVLVNHLGRVQGWVAEMVRQGASDRVPFPGRPDAVTPEWLLDQNEALVAALEEAGPDRPVWTFAGMGTSRFWIRRQAVEAAIHRWDAQLASGPAEPVETELALAGVDEMLDFFLPLRVKPDQLTGSAHLHATDSEHGEWIVQPTPDEILVGHNHEKADVALRAPASDLLLMVWGRTPMQEPEVFGDASVLASLQQALAGAA